MGGTYESFFLPEVIERSAQEGYMADLSARIKQAVSVPVVTAGRITGPGLAERILEEDQADLIGLARMILTDPDWVHKPSLISPRNLLPNTWHLGGGLEVLLLRNVAAIPGGVDAGLRADAWLFSHNLGLTLPAELAAGRGDRDIRVNRWSFSLALSLGF